MSSNIGYQILQAVKRRVEALNLDDVRDIQLQTKPLTDDQIRPGAYITPPTKGNGHWETFPKKTNERQIVGYGCQITVVHGSLGEWNGAPDQVMDWRQTVRRKFNDNGLADRHVRDHGLRVSLLRAAEGLRSRLRIQ